MNNIIVKNRLEYIDCIRGLMMLLVVFSHIETFSLFQFTYETPISKFFQLFRMPLFFFISGFVTYRALNKGNINYNKELIKKTRVLLIPTFVFGIIYSFYIGKDCLQSLMEPDKTGYWFTLVSFEMFFVVFNVLKHCDIKGEKWTYILVGIAVLLALVKFPMKMFPSLCKFGNITSFHHLFEYFQFFVFGILASKYIERFHELLDTKWVMACSIPLFVIFYCVKNNIPHTGVCFVVLEKILGFVLAYLGIIVVYALFRKNQDSFMSSSKIGTSLKYIGRRTLDIYMLHYFFLPQLPALGEWLKSCPNVAVELAVVILLSLLVVGICIVVSNIIRVSDVLAYYLFGKRKIE